MGGIICSQVWSMDWCNYKCSSVTSTGNRCHFLCTQVVKSSINLLTMHSIAISTTYAIMPMKLAFVSEGTCINYKCGQEYIPLVWGVLSQLWLSQISM